MNIYFISGLGADEKIFEKIKLPEDFSLHFIRWVEPTTSESLQHYCKRLAEQIQTSKDFVLVGLSFGGIVAIEMNKFLKPLKTIIISSVATSDELPFHINAAGFLKLHRVIPTVILKIPNPVTDWFFSADTKKEKEMLHYFLKTATPTYLKWSMNAILNWKNQSRLSNLIHIHGKNDRIFPASKTKADYLVDNAGHFLVYEQADEVSEIIRAAL